MFRLSFFQMNGLTHVKHSVPFSFCLPVLKKKLFTSWLLPNIFLSDPVQPSDMVCCGTTSGKKLPSELVLIQVAKNPFLHKFTLFFTLFTQKILCLVILIKYYIGPI